MATDPTPQLWSVGPFLVDPTTLTVAERTAFWVIAQVAEADNTITFVHTGPTSFAITTPAGDSFTITVSQNGRETDEPAQPDLGPQRLPDRTGAAHP